MEKDLINMENLDIQEPDIMVMNPSISDLEAISNINNDIEIGNTDISLEETPCKNIHIHCKDCSIKWCNKCKKSNIQVKCQVCNEVFEKEMNTNKIERNKKIEKYKKLILYSFGIIIPSSGLIMLLVYVIKTVKDIGGCVIASLFIISALIYFVAASIMCFPRY